METKHGLNVITLSDQLEGLLNRSLVESAAGMELQLEPGLQQRFLQVLDQGLDYCQAEGFTKISLLCDPRIRLQLRRLIEKTFPHLPVLSYAEIASGFQVNPLVTLEV